MFSPGFRVTGISDTRISSLSRSPVLGNLWPLVTVLATLQDFANGGPLRDDVSLTVIQRDAKFEQ
jgi:hypothetical protein